MKTSAKTKKQTKAKTPNGKRGKAAKAKKPETETSDRLPSSVDELKASKSGLVTSLFLSGRDKEIFELRTVADEPMTLQEIGDMYGITRERARQIERRMMDRLRDYLREELGDAVDVALGIGE